MVLSGAVAVTSGWAPSSTVAPTASPGNVAAAALATGIPTGSSGDRASPAGGSPAFSTLSSRAAASPDVKAPPALVLLPSMGNVSTPVTFSATGFTHVSPFTISYTNSHGVTVNACSGETTTTGTFGCSIVIPPLGAGAHSFTAADLKGKTAKGTFTVNPQLILNPSKGLVGTQSTIQGTGFGSQAVKSGAKTVVIDYNVTVTWAEGTVCAHVQDTSGGGFNCTLTIPAVPAGPWKFTGVDNKSHIASAPFTVTPGLTVGPTYGVDGTNVSFAGTGFAPVSDITVKWSQGTACSTESLGSGEFTCTYRIPFSTPGGEYNFSANDSDANVARALFIITFLKVSPASGPVYTNVTLTAGGFAAVSPLSIMWGSTTACSGGSTTIYGTFVCRFEVPPTTAGPHLFVATDGAGNSAVAQFTIQPTLTPHPGFGMPGSSVTFNGSGFGGGSLTVVSWLYGTACSATASSLGGFSCSFRIPVSTPRGPYTFTGEDAARDQGTATFVVTYLTLTPSSGPGGAPGASTTTSLSVAGAGFSPHAPFTVSWGALTVCGGGRISATGSFSQSNCSAPFKVPYSVGGPHVLVAVDGSGYSANATFIVTPLLTFPRASYTVNSTIVFSGTGFNASSPVTISWAGGTACTVTTSALGAFNCTKYTIPPTAAGSYLFTASDPGRATASATVSLITTLSATPDSGSVNSTVQFAATGFADSSGITIAGPSGVACAGTTTSGGSYSCKYTIPPTPAGAYTFTATDASSHTATVTYTVDSLLVESPTSGPNGTIVTFGGTGFDASTPVVVSWSPSGTSETACTAVSSLTGGFTCSFAVPAVPDGPYVFSATGGSGSTSVTFTVMPALSAAPTRGPVGTLITFVGTGFPALHPAWVNWSAGVACSHTTSTEGGFSCSFALPPTDYGVHSFTANDTKRGISASATFTVAPALTVSPVAGPVATLLEFNGSGFSPDSAVTVSWSFGTICTATSNAFGSFQCTVTLPAATNGAHLFTATDGMGHSATATFSVSAQLIPTPSSGLVGTKVTFAGTGFANTVLVTVSWTGGTACSNTTSASGAFTCKFTVPVGTPGGVYPFTAADGPGDNAVATFTVVTSLAVSPGHGIAGTSVTFTGSGYAASSSVSVTWSGGSPCSATTTASGTFSCAYAIPLGTPGGSYTFTGKDSKQDTAYTTFVVTFLNVTPAGGVAGTPVEFTAGGYAESSVFSIAWSGGTACSGATTTDGTFACSYTIPAITSPGKYTFTGADGLSNEATTSFTVFGVPSVTVPAPSHPGIDVGQSVSFSTTASGGSGTYATYTWSESAGGLGCTLANAASITCTPTTASKNYTVTVSVTDSNGVLSAPATTSKYTVSPALIVSTPVLTPGSLDVNQNATFTTTATGGSGGLTYTWLGLPTGCSGTTHQIVCVPTGVVTAQPVTVTVVDSNGNSVTSAPLLLTVFSDPSVLDPTASRASADVGQSVTFTASAAGGSGGLTYQWIGLPDGCGDTGSPITCSPSAPAMPATIKVKVTDSNGFHITSGVLSFTVYSDPKVTTPTASAASADLGQTITFSTSATNGSGSFTYTWSGLPAGCLASTASFHCTPTATATALSISVTITDSNGYAVTSEPLTFTVYPDPAAAAPTPNVPGIDLGQSVTFNAHVTGGATPFTFDWAGLPSGCSGTGPSLVCAVSNPLDVGVYSVSYTVVDANGYNATSGDLEFRVSTDPTVSTPTSSVASVDVNQTVTFSVSAGGGSGDLSYSWSNLPDGCAGTTSVVVCTPMRSVAGAQISVTVTDLNGFEVTSSALTFTVYATPVAGTPSASVVSADVGQGVTFTVGVAGGSGGFTYAWSNLPGGCSGTTATIVCASVSGATTYDISVVVEDSNGVANSSLGLAFTVFTDPTVSAPMPDHPGADVGETVTFTVIASGGNGTLSYTWSGLPSGCSGTTTSVVTCTPLAALAETSISVNVTDGNGFTAVGSSISYTVSPSLSVKVSVSPSSLLKGASITIQALVTGGSGTYTYVWTGLPGGCGPSSSAKIDCTPTITGTFHPSVTVTDSNGGTAQAASSGTVNPSFLGLPSAEGLALVAGIAVLALVVLIVVAVLVLRRRRRAAPLPWAPTPGVPPTTGYSESVAPAPVAWQPPPPAEPAVEEPSPWEVPPPEPEHDDFSPPEGQ
ncbi:MAG: hypothetical protein WBG19_08135 [Thermoplasmata archaeon]